ncbi:flagellar basal body L-ring protein FlgH [Chitinimonas lacunae]|uniref:Flagellar L-ring protein n=1 Tax=Chitinimonas lacunae TaxID=1963018 RepID=A0ABV8MXZ1_9NEIS
MKRVWRPLGLLLCSVLAAGQSLYVEQQFKPLVADQRAQRVGDVLTVVIYENASASSGADTSSDRNSGAGFNAELLGHPKRAGQIGTSVDFDGRGRTQRSGRLLAQISVTVQGQADNGDLLIAGQQAIAINDEKQEIKLTGRVRPQDISDGNTVLSSRVAEAQISYVGDGALAERQRPGWWNRLLVLLGL